MRVKLGLSLVLLCAMSACLMAEPAKPAIDIKAKPFPLGDVKLLDSPFKKAMEVNKAYLLKLDVDRMLWPFHDRAKMPTKGERYGGWEQRDCVGQTSGHYLSALSLMYAATGDPEMKKRADYMVDELAKIQEKHGDGYAGSMRTEVWDKTFGGTIEVHQWGLGGGYVPWYVLHKTFAGLIDAYEQTGNEKALEVAKKFGKWAKKGTDNLDEKKFQEMLRCEWGGMNDVLAKLYSLTGDKDFLELARRFDHKVIIDPLAKKEDRLQGVHVNTQIPKIIGAARMHEMTGEDRDATIAKHFWDLAVNTRSFASGGFDLRERFCAPNTEAEHLSWNNCETCCVYNMLKLSRHLFGWEPSTEVMDFYEHGLYNQILGSQDPETGGFTYFYPMRPGHFKIYSVPFDSMWCCVGSGMENHSKYGETIYFHNDDTLFVNLFIPSELDWKDKGVKIRQETKFPAEDTTTLTVSTKKPQKLSVSIRVPYWVKGAAEIKVNGEKQSVAAKPSSYATITRTWKDGDKIEATLPMGLHLRKARDDEKMVTVMYGPLVLAGELGTEGMPENDNVSGNTAHSGNLAPPVPMLVIDSDDPSDWVKPVEGEPLKWKTSGVGKPRDVSLMPLGLLHHQRYTVYWKTMTPAEYDALPKASVEPAKVSASSLKPGVAYKYYEGSWSKLPDFSKQKVVKEGVSKNIDLSPKQKNDDFGLVYTGYLKVDKAGDYAFALKSDDGSKLWIGGKEIVDHDGMHPADAKVGLTLTLKPGIYPIKLDYFEKIYHEGLEVLWYAGEGGWTRIPDGALFH